MRCYFINQNQKYHLIAEYTQKKRIMHLDHNRRFAFLFNFFLSFLIHE